MGDFMLACLLGQEGGAQSFDVASHAPVSGVGSWSPGAATSWSFQGGDVPSAVHSSARALRAEVGSQAGPAPVMTYAYGRADDAHARWDPAVDTHVVETLAWMRAGPAASSGDLLLRLEGLQTAAARLPGAAGSAALQPVALRTTVASAAGGAPRWELAVASGSAADSGTAAVVDDVLTTVDPLVLHPEWSFRERAQLIREQHRTRSGELHGVVWSRFLAYRVPLRFLARAEADRLNHWWRTQQPLVFTLDSSDAESRYVVRIVNDTQPVGRRLRPYDDRFAGALELESVRRGGLVF